MAIASPQRTVVTFRDVRGFTGIHTFYINAAVSPDRYAAAAMIVGLVSPLSVAALQRCSGLYTTQSGPVQYGAEGVYGSVYDKAVMVFDTEFGGIARYEIPAPIDSIFLADRETVDPGNSDVSTWVSAMLSEDVCSLGAANLTRFFGGRLERHTKPTRLTSYALRPDLNGPGW